MLNSIFKKVLAATAAAFTVGLLAASSPAFAAARDEGFGPRPFISIADDLVAGIGAARPHDGDCYFTQRPFFDEGGTFRGMRPAEICS